MSAIVQRAVEARCDICGRSETYTGYYARNCWTALKRAGWKFRKLGEGGYRHPQRALCPACARNGWPK